MHCYTRSTQINNRCIEGGKSRGVLKDFRMARVCFRAQLLAYQVLMLRAVPIQNECSRRKHTWCEESKLVMWNGYPYEAVHRYSDDGHCMALGLGGIPSCISRPSLSSTSQTQLCFIILPPPLQLRLHFMIITSVPSATRISTLALYENQHSSHFSQRHLLTFRMIP